MAVVPPPPDAGPSASGPRAPGEGTSLPDASATPLAAVELVHVAVELVEPLRSAHGEERTREVVLVRAVHADGAEGWGECSALRRPTYTHEDTAGAWRILHDELVPAALAGVEPEVRTHPMAAAALACARLDLALRREGRRLVDAVGGGDGPLPVAAVVGRAGSAAAVIERVAARVAEGAALVKLKVGPGGDPEVVRSVRDRWPDLPVAVDANGSLDERAVDALDGLGLAYLEQPLPADELVRGARAAAGRSTAVALDEAVTSPGSAEAALALGAGRVVNVKPARLGGVAAALATIAVVRDGGAGWFVGGMLETGVGRAAALAVAALPGAAFPTDLGPSSRYLDDDVTEPVEADAHGRLVLPSGPGIGVTPRPDRLATCARRRVVLRP